MFGIHGAKDTESDLLVPLERFERTRSCDSGLRYLPPHQHNHRPRLRLALPHRPAEGACRLVYRKVPLKADKEAIPPWLRLVAKATPADELGHLVAFTKRRCTLGTEDVVTGYKPYRLVDRRKTPRPLLIQTSALRSNATANDGDYLLPGL